MHTSLILYAEHEFNASTFTSRVVAGTGSDMYSAICGGIGALRGPKHGGANEVAFEIQKRYDNPDEAEAEVKRAAVASARRVIVVADASKLGEESLVRFGGLDDIDALVTDGEPDADLSAALRAADVDLVRA